MKKEKVDERNFSSLRKRYREEKFNSINEILQMFIDILMQERHAYRYICLCVCVCLHVFL